MDGIELTSRHTVATPQTSVTTSRFPTIQRSGNSTTLRTIILVGTRTIGTRSVTSYHCYHRFSFTGCKSEDISNLCHDRLSTYGAEFTIQRTGFDASVGKSATTGIATSTTISLGKYFSHLGNPRVFIHGKFLGSHIKNSGQHERYSSQ